MEKILFFAALIAVLFTLLKYLEMRYLDKEPRPIKIFLRDGLYAFAVSTAALYAMTHFGAYIDDFIAFITGSKVVRVEKTPVFTGEPAF
jgi:hypothetical protein